MGHTAPLPPAPCLEARRVCRRAVAPGDDAEYTAMPPIRSGRSRHVERGGWVERALAREQRMPLRIIDQFEESPHVLQPAGHTRGDPTFHVFQPLTSRHLDRTISTRGRHVAPLACR